MQVSSELKSQVFSKYIISELLVRLDRTRWMQNYNVHDLYIEVWAVGIWVKQAGVISYKDLAEILREEAINKAEQLPVDKVAAGWLVKSRQCGDRYLVKFNKIDGWSCCCLRYQCWRKRLANEMPQLYKALGKKVFCHHIAAAYSSALSASGATRV